MGFDVDEPLSKLLKSSVSELALNPERRLVLQRHAPMFDEVSCKRLLIVFK